jgi:hypothetical protein
MDAVRHTMAEAGTGFVSAGSNEALSMFSFGYGHIAHVLPSVMASSESGVGPGLSFARAVSEARCCPANCLTRS